MKRAKPSIAKKQQFAAVVRNQTITRYREKWGKLLTAAQITQVVQTGSAKKLMVEVLSFEPPPPVKLPPATGRKGALKLNDDLANEICTQLQRGASLALVASWVGVSAQLLNEWLRKDGEPYLTFQTAVSKSLAYAEMNMINAIRLGCYNDPHVALKWMAMRYPEKYAPDVQQMNIGSVNFDFVAVLQEALDNQQKRLALSAAPKVIEGEVTASEPVPQKPDKKV